MRSRSSSALAAFLAFWAVAPVFCGDMTVAPPEGGNVVDLTNPTDRAFADLKYYLQNNPDLWAAYAFLKIKLDSPPPDQRSPGTEQIAELNRQFHELQDRTDVFAAQVKLSTAAANYPFTIPRNYLRDRIWNLSLTVIPLDLDALSGALADQERRMEALEHGLPRAGRGMPPRARKSFIMKLSSINEDGSKLWTHLHTTALNIGSIGSPLVFEQRDGVGRWVLGPSGKLDARAGDLQARIAQLSRRIQAMDRRLGAGLAKREERSALNAAALQKRVGARLKDPFGPRFGEVPAAAGAAGPAVQVEAPSLAAMRHPPILLKPTLRRSRPYTGSKGEDAYPKESEQVIAMLKSPRRLAYVIGDPVGRAKYVFPQRGGTCKIGAGMSAQMEAGVIPKDAAERSRWEDRFYALAVQQRCFTGSAADPNRRETGGTPNECLGNLPGLRVRKYFMAADGDLYGAALRGKILLVKVDPGILWNDKKHLGKAHAVALTGVVVERVTKRPLAYYINDTGQNEGGRMIAVKQFLDAWHATSSIFVEPQ